MSPSPAKEAKQGAGAGARRRDSRRRERAGRARAQVRRVALGDVPGLQVRSVRGGGGGEEVRVREIER